ncbi:MAG: NAD(P)H-dependent oxidoreductase [Armatimonadetes bacterium]|nr:NAD(P)H-dependent oxidoreductase [Armatimonadota bacterium]
MPDRNVAVIVGSLRKNSYSQMVADALIALAPKGLKFEFLEIGNLPFYNPDLEAEKTPKEWVAFRAQISKADAFLVVTPEYNRSIPGVLKNALDIGTRPYGHNGWTGKPAGIVSSSPGGIGGFGANHHLRQVMVGCGIKAMATPDVYLGGVGALFNESGELINDKTREFLTKFMAAFGDWIEANAAEPRKP